MRGLHRWVFRVSGKTKDLAKSGILRGLGVVDD